MVKANQQLLATLSNPLLRIFLIVILSFTNKCSYALDKRSHASALKKTISEPTDMEKNIKKLQASLALLAKTLKFASSKSTSAETIKLIKILEFLSPLSPPQFCTALDTIISPSINKIIVLGIVTHQRKCEYDRIATGYRLSDSRTVSHVVDKAGGASARSGSLGLDLSLAKTPERLRELGDHLSFKAKSVGTGLKESWREGLKRVQSFTPIKSKLSQEFKPSDPVANLDHLPASHTLTRLPTGLAIHRAQPTGSVLRLRLDTNPHSSDDTSAPVHTITHYHAKDQAFRAEQAAQHLQEAQTQTLIAQARYKHTAPPLLEKSQQAYGPFFFAENMSTTDNIAHYNRSIKIILDMRLAKQAIKDDMATQIIYGCQEEDDFTKLLDKFAGVKPTHKLLLKPVYAKHQTPPIASTLL